MTTISNGRIDNLLPRVWRSLTAKQFSFLQLFAYGIAVTIFGRPLGAIIQRMLGL